MKIFLLPLIAFLLPALGFSQKKVIDASAYPNWKRVGEIQQSPDGKYAAYTIKPFKGDGYVHWVNLETGKHDSVARGSDPVFAGSSQFLAFRVTPAYDTLRKLELKKVKKDKWPKDSLFIVSFSNDSLLKFAGIERFSVSPDGNSIAWLSSKNEFPKGYLSKSELKKEEKKRAKLKVESEGKLLSAWNPDRKRVIAYRDVEDFHWSKKGTYLAFTTTQKYEKRDSLELRVMTMNKDGYVVVGKRKTAFEHLNFGKSDNYLIGLSTADTGEVKRLNGFLFNCETGANLVFSDTSARYENGRWLTSRFSPKLSDDASAIYFGVWDKPVKTPKDTLLDSEKAKLDVWNWKDERLQPQQLVELKRDEMKSSLWKYDVATGTAIQLGQDSLSIHLSTHTETKYLLASCDDQYAYQSWRAPLPENYYRIDLKDGKTDLLRANAVFQAWLSPSGNYFTYFEEAKQQLYCKDLVNETETCLTCKEKANWFEDLNGQPMMAGPLGILGWTEKEQGVLIQSEFGIWHYDFNTDNLVSLTESLDKGEKNSAKYSIGQWQNDSIYLSPQILYLTRLDTKTKAETVYKLSGSFAQPAFEEITSGDFHYTGLKKAKYGSNILFQRQSVQEYPDVWAKVPGRAVQRLSHANPQQSEYNWATVELIHWKSYEGLELDGLLYKPENFDPNQQYPMIVYFYELYSDELHNHYAPRPTASIIFPTEYASAGYIVLIPDIRYKPGHPAQSAYDCIMSATDAAIRKYPNIDPKRLGLQGQSWGGYQTAQLVTMTDRYAAAMAGAPVGNMFSAYGGIRWGSGYSRQFQYEHTQSRIGHTMWESPQLYIENSPVFHLTKVKTPLLIMHNDGDGAVPWYQGVEIFTGLRRLQKPVWLLNYNGDDHNLMKTANRIDLSIRMRQFFDYYLNNGPLPKWLGEGLPALDKGKKYNLETIEQ